MVRSDEFPRRPASGPTRGGRLAEGDGDDGDDGPPKLFRYEKRHYRVLETLALPGAEDAPVR